jgi:hypothetical protein
MNRRIVRSYYWTTHEVAVALVAQLKLKDVPAPEYVGDTKTTKWIIDSSGVRVEWTDEGEVELQ